MAAHYFSWLDYVLFILMLIVSALIGVYFAFFSKSKQNSRKDYLMGGKTMGVLPIACSLSASMVSGITLMTVPTEVYTYGTQYVICVLSNILCAGVIAYIYLPVFYELQVTSSYEYLEKRFSRGTRTMASLLYGLRMIIHMPMVVYIPALSFSQVTGVSVHKVTPALMLICMFYTSLGGMRAVVWTDTLQSVVTYGGLIAVIWMGVSKVGSFGEVWERAEEGGRLILFDMDPSIYARMSFWSVTIGLTTTWISEMGINQCSIQRYLSVPTLKDARTAGWLVALAIILIRTMCVVTGLVIYGMYYNCDPLTTGEVEKADQLLPYYVTKEGSNIPGLPGVFLAGIFSAALSTMSSGLNTISGTIYEDFIKSYMPNASEKTASNIMKVTVALVGLLCVALAFVVEKLGSVMQLSLSLGGVTQGALLGLFSLGMLFPRANTKGAIAGAVSSLVIMTWIILGAQTVVAKKELRYPYLNMSTAGCEETYNTTSQIILKNIHEQGHSNDDVFFLYRIGFLYYTVLGVVIFYVVGIPVSLLTAEPEPVHPSLLTPLVRRWAQKVPEAYYKTVDDSLVELKTLNDGQNGLNGACKQNCL